MRAKLAVFLVATVVFAPAWDPDVHSRLATSSDVAARVLAPTFDEATIRPALSVHKRLEELSADPREDHGVPWSPTAPLPQPRDGLLDALLVLAIAVLAGSFLVRPGRAPPVLPVV